MSELKHYGTPRRSGRYPWGSSGQGSANAKDFLGYVSELRKQGLSQVDIAEGLGLKTTELRANISLANAEKKQADYSMAYRLRDKGMSYQSIAERMNLPNESSVRSLLDPSKKWKQDVTMATADMLKENLEKTPYLDIGAGVERYIGVSKTKLKTAVAALEKEGYKIHYLKTEQLGTGQYTWNKVLTKPGVEWSEVNKNKDKIGIINSYTQDTGKSYLNMEPPKPVSSKKLQVVYAEDGGTSKDGLIEVRRGVDELSLDKARYAQARINIDDTHYLKGMVVYADDLPPGVDIRFNTNKSKSNKKILENGDLGALKELKEDKDNPFGATVRQRKYLDKNGKEQLSAINIVNEEGDWDSWGKNISSQVLSKQSSDIAKKQLDLAFDMKQEEFNDIMSLTNPVVKRKLLEGFADDADSSAVHLKAAALPRQSTKVLIPFPNMKEDEVYCPTYNNGETVVLIRYPHGGKFEIPEVKVNNRNKEAKAIINQAKDAIGLHPKVAERLSGADFDGDTVIVIPINPGKNAAIKTQPALKDLVGFDPQAAYPGYEGMKVMTPKAKGIQMGNVSNLITDMTIKGATQEELARAVRHSMVVIDAEKHKLNYKLSERDNNISNLKEKYQGGANRGASTVISKASSEKRVGLRKEYIDPRTGKKVYVYTGETYTNKAGQTKLKETKSSKMAETDDAFTLSSGTPMEKVYATHANKLKEIANTARKEAVSTEPTPYSKEAKATYAKEVGTLNSKLNIALKNAPLERKAQLLANVIVEDKKKNTPNMEYDDLKKVKGQALAEARERTGASKKRVVIEPKEWEAIQAGAISTSKLKDIINNSDQDTIKQLAMPRTKTGMSTAKTTKAKQLMKSGYTQAEVANALGVSLTTLTKALD